jgi:hypothetical protein
VETGCQGGQGSPRAVAPNEEGHRRTLDSSELPGPAGIADTDVNLLPKNGVGRDF